MPKRMCRCGRAPLNENGTCPICDAPPADQVKEKTSKDQGVLKLPESKELRFPRDCQTFGNRCVVTGLYVDEGGL